MLKKRSFAMSPSLSCSPNVLSTDLRTPNGRVHLHAEQSVSGARRCWALTTAPSSTWRLYEAHQSGQVSPHRIRGNSQLFCREIETIDPESWIPKPLCTSRIPAREC